jgi:protein-tyrosine phosphatase
VTPAIPPGPLGAFTNVEGVIDIHAHILPGVDDGVRSVKEARELALRAAGEGTEAIVATPHVRTDFPTTAERMEHGVVELRDDFVRHEVPVQVLPGGEVSLDLLWQMPHEELLRFSLAQTGRYLLLEFPYRAWVPALDAGVMSLLQGGLTPILAHPERNPDVQDQPARLADLVEAGALVQVTAVSLAGRLDAPSQATAEKLLRLGLVHLLATDAHGPHIREGGMAAAAEAVGDHDLARYLTQEAPAAIVAGEPLPDRPTSY